MITTRAQIERSSSEDSFEIYDTDDIDEHGNLKDFVVDDSPIIQSTRVHVGQKRSRREVVTDISKELKRIKNTTNLDFEDEADSDYDGEEHEMYLQFKYEHMNPREPTMRKILEANLPLAEKIKCVERFEILSNMEPNNIEYLTLRNEIREILDTQHKYTTEQIASMDLLEHSLEERVKDIATMKHQIINLQCSDRIRDIILEKYVQFSRLEPNESNYGVLREWLEHVVNLPFQNSCPPKIDFVTSNTHDIRSINHAFQQFHESVSTRLYGMQRVRDEICLIFNDRAVNPRSTSSVIGLCGKPGVGKTRVSRVVAEAMGLPFETISMGGIGDATIFKGSKRDWVGAAPSLILQILQRTKSNNPVILLDEIEKAEPVVQNVLLHILDPSQSHEFRDAFIHEFPHDISKIIFMATINDPSRLIPPLRNRIRMIQIDDYDLEELVTIARDYVLPEVLAELSLPKDKIVLHDSGIRWLYNKHLSETMNTGVRPIEREIRNVISKINYLRRVTLSNGTTNGLPIGFTIPNFDPTFKRRLILNEAFFKKLYK